MGKKYNFDYIVIGSGPAGSAAALSLAKAKKNVALVEGKHFGGSNLNTRDVPYGVALNFAHTYSRASAFPELGGQEISFNFPSIIAHQLKAIIETGGNNKKIFEAAGITCIEGYANFLDHNTIAVGDKQYTAANFILATGSRLKVNEISGVKIVNHLTPETAIKIRRIPKAVLVVGGGPTGCEIAEYFAELGTKVLITEISDRLLPREDKEVGEIIMDYFANHLGITVLPSSKVIALEQDDISKRVIFHNAGSEKMVRVDCIVLATGSEPVLDYGLENAGVKYKDSGVIADRYFQTSAKNIYAIGDILGKPTSSTERANYEGTLLASNLVNKTKNLVSYRGFIRVTNTLPEIATIGLNEDDLIRRDRKYKKAIVYLDQTPASKILNFRHGFVKILADRNNRIIGATIVAPNASLMAEEISLAIRHQLPVIEIASTPHIMNGFSHAIKLAAREILEKKK